MPLVPCPYCGKSISDAAPACIHCGASPGPGGRAAPRAAGSSPLTLVLVVVGALFGGVMLIGVLAAIAIPRFASVAKSAREAEAGPALKQVLALEQLHRDRSGAFVADLSRIGWEDPALRYYTISVVKASDRELCVEAAPIPGVGDGLSVQSIDEAGRIFRGGGCEDGSGAAPGWSEAGPGEGP